MAASLPAIAVPGQRLGDRSEYISGPGTHIQGSFVCASIAGPVIVRHSLEKAKKQPHRGILTVGRSPIETVLKDIQTVNNNNGNESNNDSSKESVKPPKLKFNTLPAVDSIILGRVTRVQKRQATLSILLVLDDEIHNNPALDLTDDQLNALIASSIDPACTPTNTADEMRFQALIRKEDVRAVEKDRVVMDEMFRVGDIVRASIISMGDQSYFYATTARNELGVVIARSEAGNMMFPVSWKEMRDPVTGVGEARKVAKPF
ncbi:hypothetical protein VTO42DRAFT_8582 [Malbranchea cinnamomea]